MKKYLKLTAAQAIDHFLLKDNTLAPETEDDIRTKLTDLNNLKSDTSVTITLPTHRTRPDSQKDVIELKNLINEAEKRLIQSNDKRIVAQIAENMKEAQESIDFSLNLDGLVLYANEYFSSVIKLPVPLQSEVVITDTFDKRPLYRAMQQTQNYYILAVSRNKIRLLEARGDKILREVDNDDFPFENTDYYTDNPKKLAQDVFTDNLNKEFMNVADKRFRKYYLTNPMPLVILGDVKTVSYYKEQMDHKNMLLGTVHGNFDNAPLHVIAAEAQPVIANYSAKTQAEYKSKIEGAASSGTIVTEIKDMFQTARDGDAALLIVGESYTPTIDVQVGCEEPQTYTTIDRLVRLMDQVCSNRGEIAFVSDDVVKGFNGMVMVRRFAY